MFPVSGTFFIVQNEFCLAVYILRGAMILVNGGLVILPHVCDDLGSVQSGHAGELLAEDSNVSWKENRTFETKERM